MKDIKYTVTAYAEIEGFGSGRKITTEGGSGSLAEDIFNAMDSTFWDGLQNCKGCSYEKVEPWDMPCEKCKRNCRDYYRHKGVE